MSDANALMAFKNAWTGAIESADALRGHADAVSAISDDATIASVDLETFHRLALANANAAQALRGLIEQLRRKHGEHAA